jgi:stage II sporulation protein AA (anti-sigma F factor antagonist)
MNKTNIDYNHEERSLTITLKGEIDHHGAKGLREEIDKEIKKTTPKTLIMDMSAITFCDSSGLGLIMGRYKTVTEYGGELFIKSPAESAKKMILLSGMDRLIKITD